MEISHDYRTRRASAFIDSVLERLSGPNQILARAYFDHQTAKGNRLSSLVNTGSYLLHLDELNGGRSFAELTPADLTSTLVKYGEKHRPSSAHRFGVYLKALYAWINKGELPKAYKAVLKRKRPKVVKKRPLSEDDFRALLHHAWGKNLGGRGWMRQALLWVLWDSGMRISEVIALRVGSVTFLPDGAATLEIPSGAPHLKTGPRTIDVAECVPALKLWLQAHPGRGNTDARWAHGAPLFPSNHRDGSAIEPTTVNRLLGTWSRNAGFNRVVTCHVFRHTRATRAAKAGWSNWQMEPYFGWVAGSKESSTYVHMVAADVAHKVREAARVDPLGALMREDPMKVLKAAIAENSERTTEAILTRLGLVKARRDQDEGDSAAPAALVP